MPLIFERHPYRLLCRSILAAAASILLLLSPCAHSAEVLVDIQVDKPQAELSPVLYGLFFEDINYSADGGLYAELVQNRSFEYYAVGGWAGNSQKLHPLYAWQKVERDGGVVDLKVSNELPLNSNNPKYLKMTIAKEGVTGIRNTGFDGIVLKTGARYNFSAYAKRDQDTENPLQVSLETNDGKTLAAGNIPGLTKAWRITNPNNSPVDGRSIGSGKPGPMFQTLLAAFVEYTKTHGVDVVN
jgi:hypothetical protein